MAGLVKAKRYDWKNSNLEFIGSKDDRAVKKESAEHEPAWQSVGKSAGLKIWRIVKFQVTQWPEEDYGKFYNGDSYIILNTTEELEFDAHFWIGSKSTQDEYGTAAYKTVELDNFLDDAAVQHREVEGHESEMFLSYFPAITIMEGGADTGFRHVTPTEYEARLLHFSGAKRSVSVRQVSLHPDRVLSSDVFILDLGLHLIQWNGNASSKDERFKAMQYLHTLKSDRGGHCQSEVVEDDSTPRSHVFWESLTGENEWLEDEKEVITPTVLHKVSDEAGHLKSTTVKEGAVSLTDFDPNDVFIMDTGDQCFVWVGQASSHTEKQNGLSYAHHHLMKTAHPLIPVHVIKQGQKCTAFLQALAA